MPQTRLISVTDAGALAELVSASRDHLEPWEPVRAPSYFTRAGQSRAIEDALALHAAGTLVPHVIVEGGAVLGRVTLSNLVRGPFESCHLGYWVGAAHTGRGVATAAVAEIVTVAFRELALHRVEAGTLAHNAASQRVLERNGFERFGVAPRYLRVAGRWQDHVLYQRLNPALE